MVDRACLLFACKVYSQLGEKLFHESTIVIYILIDVDECVSGRHGCDRIKYCHYSYTKGEMECVHTASCTNTLGGHTCSCSVGFTGDGSTCDGRYIIAHQ